MKSEIVGNQEVQNEREYPWLGIADNGSYQAVVLFTYPGEGAIVHATSAYQQGQIGVYQDGWEMEDFKEFKGQVILSND